MTSTYNGKVLWSQLDANMHLRHSAYADFAAQARIEAFEHLGLTMELYRKFKIGPILFREELIYHKEIGINESISVTTALTAFDREKSRYSIRNEIFKNNGEKAATVNIDGAWIDIEKRKLTKLPEEITERFLTLGDTIIR